MLDLLLNIEITALNLVFPCRKLQTLKFREMERIKHCCRQTPTLIIEVTHQQLLRKLLGGFTLDFTVKHFVY